MSNWNVVASLAPQQKETPTNSASIGLSEVVSQSTDIIDFSFNFFINLSKSVSLIILL